MTPQQLRALKALNRFGNRLSPQLRDAFLKALQKLQLGADVEAATDAIARGDLKAALDALLPEQATAQFTHDLTVALSKITNEQGPTTAREIAKILRVDFSYVPGSSAASEALAGLVSSMVLPVLADARAGLMAVLAAGLRAGQNPRVVAREARAFVSLTANDAAMVRSFVEQLKNDPALALTRALRDGRYDAAIRRAIDGETLTDEQIATMEAAYTRRLIAFRAETWSRTATLTALRTTQHTAWLQAADDLKIPRTRMIKTWITTLDGRERPTHHALHGDTVPIDQPFANGDMVPGDGTGDEGTEYNCFPAGTLVEGAFVAGLKAVYSGPMREIKTARGYRLTMTSNHPVLTDQGWIAAHALRKGDTLFSYRRKIDAPSAWLGAARRVNDEYRPSPIEDVFEAMRANGAGIFRRVASNDLHGDAQFIRREIDVVYADARLWFESRLTVPDGVDHRRFALPDVRESFAPSLSAAQLDIDAVDLAAARGMRRSDLSLDGSGIALDAAPLQQLRSGLAAHWHTALGEPSKQDVATVPAFIAQLFEASAGAIASDQVVDVRDFNPRGASTHVYDLQAVDGWILAQGIVTSNCRCVEVVRLLPANAKSAAEFLRDRAAAFAKQRSAA